MAGENPNTPNTPGNVGGLIADVEHKMSELMAWHKTQVTQFEDDKAKFESDMATERAAIQTQRDEQAQALEKQQKTLADNLEQVEQQRIKLAALANKLRAEESAMSREWGEVQKEREAVQKQAADLAKLREQVQDRAKAWLDTTAKDLNQPLKLAGTDSEETHHQEAA